MENRITAASERTFLGSSEVSVTSSIPTGSIMAATVCSPMNEASRPETIEIPKHTRVVFVPVMRTMSQAMRLSRRCRTTATASIREPMMNSTESFIRLLATSVDSRPMRRTSQMMMSSATPGRGMGSVMNRIVATTDMARTIWPARVSPSGGSKLNRAKPTISAMKNHFFSQK